MSVVVYQGSREVARFVTEAAALEYVREWAAKGQALGMHLQAGPTRYACCAHCLEGTIRCTTGHTHGCDYDDCVQGHQVS